MAWSDSTTDRTGVCLAIDVDDFSWANSPCNAAQPVVAAGSGSARMTFVAPRNSGVAFLEFNARFNQGGPYDFTVESIQHKIGLNLRRMLSATRRATVRGRAVLADGSPVADGLRFGLKVRWRGGTRSYVSAARAGNVSFRLRLPANARHKTASLTVSRGADTSYLAARGPTMNVRIR